MVHRNDRSRRRGGRWLAPVIGAIALLLGSCIADTETGPTDPGRGTPELDALKKGEIALPMECRLEVPATTTASFSAAECQNSPGPYIVMEGAMTLGGLGLQLIFRNNARGTHEHVEQVTVSMTIIPEGESITLPKQPSAGGVGGNPFIWIQLLDSEGEPITDEVFLGRCVQGLDAMALAHLLPAEGIISSVAAECSNSPGPWITVDGLVVMSGVTARLIFRNNDNPVGGPHEAMVTTTVDVEILPETEIVFPKQPVLGGVGGNPHIFAQFVDGDGNPISPEWYIGRCVQL